MSVKKIKDEKILILGGSGFIGSNLVNYLIENNVKHITVVTEKIDERVSYNLGDLKDKIRVIEADIRYEKEIEKLVKDHTLIFNFAAQSGAVNSTEKPFLNLDINGKGVLNLLNACRNNNTSAKVIFLSSRLVYGIVDRIPVKESQPLNPGNIYSIHKILGEYYMQLYAKLYGIKTIILRLTNPYGPRQPFWQSEYGIINYFIYLAMKDEELKIFGDGKQLRDYIYIDDLTKVLITIACANYKPGAIFNLGSGKGVKLIDMARAVCKIIGRGRVKKVPWPKLYKKVETGDFVSDISKIKNSFSWIPEVDLEPGIKKTVDFIKNHPLFIERLKGEL
ncbi:NAD-dependent epimerase/dehydratase family protein [Candidatus Dependentiae bacterium]|nr:NAD-dependent epimerase/dehydratase family protein [Candidatus Dependentiae bacterium]